MAHRPIKRRKLYQEVMDRLIELIREQNLRPGDQLPSERQLMEEYGVGRPAIREAFQNLERLGILEIKHGERARITVPSSGFIIEQIGVMTHYLLDNSPQNIEHLREARILFEVEMARRAALKATDEDISQLEQLLLDHQEARHDLTKFSHRDMLFHRQIASIDGNPIYPVLVQAMFEWLRQHHPTLVRAPGAEEITLAEHARILAAIAAHDPDAAATAIREHLLRANAQYRQFENQSASVESI
ncbi:MAG: transcriptional regulator NanR [Candidatus Competibacteraceae bacterium]|nr:transcriptional regulator NanR [Candidatus Competibacteraceae bacterium]MCB1806058.1 transcriptional regulator NanR [Candidatus Competibacteraceae bacterium]MCB1815433.1 transcriptional regulator NanR [Candidatus Competibacteraceae bacterium]